MPCNFFYSFAGKIPFLISVRGISLYIGYLFSLYKARNKTECPVAIRLPFPVCQDSVLAFRGSIPSRTVRVIHCNFISCPVENFFSPVQYIERVLVTKHMPVRAERAGFERDHQVIRRIGYLCMKGGKSHVFKNRSHR